MSPAHVRDRLAARVFPAWPLWLIPPLFCLYIYWPSLKTWFSGDDFAWLGLLRDIHSARDLWEMIFQPTQHGTWRPLSERAFFIVLERLFGIDALPFHICIFATQSANLALLASIVSKTTGSRIAAFCAPVFWIVNPNMDTVMSWPSSYMEVLCGFCILLAFRLLLAYIETGQRRYYWWQWAVFLTGFGVMESTVVYPAIAAAYTFFRARKQFVATLPMFAASAVFVTAHMLLAPKAAEGAYAMHFDFSMIRTFWIYWVWVIAPQGLTIFTRVPARAVMPMVWIFTVPLVVFIVRRAIAKDWLPLIFFSWFVILLLPVAPLRDHVSDYYLTLPLIGVAALGGYAFSCAWNGVSMSKALGGVLAAIYLFTAIPVARGGSKWWYHMGRDVQTIVMGVATVHQLHPGKTILLTNISNIMFWKALFDRPLHALGIPDNVYVDPNSAENVEGHEGAASVSDFVMPATVIRKGLDEDALVVYQPDGDHLRNITEFYSENIAPTLKSGTPRRVDAANPIQDYLFGPEWYRREGTYRWMPKRATVSIGGPTAAGERLYVSGRCVAEQLRGGPLEITVTAGDLPLGTSQITNCDRGFQFDYALPESLRGKEMVQLAIEVNRTIVPPLDGRELGLVFGTFEIR